MHTTLHEPSSASATRFSLLMAVALAACSARVHNPPHATPAIEAADAGNASDVVPAAVGGAVATPSAVNSGAAGEAGMMASAGAIADAAGMTGASGAASPSIAGASAQTPTAPAGGAGVVPAAGSGGAPAVAGTRAPPAAIDCSRAGLAALVDAYLTALAAGDPRRVPFAATVKLTENAKPVPLGEGLWKTGGQLTAQRSALDPQTCSTATEAILDQQGMPILIGLRLKLELSSVTEVETYTAKIATQPGAAAKLPAGDWGTRTQPSSRQALSALAEAYFDNFSDPTQTSAFATPCDQATNGTSPSSFAIAGAPPPPRVCGSIILPAIPGLIELNARATQRRYPVIDEETGIVLALGIVVNNVPLFSLLKTVDGKIRFIDAISGAPPVSSLGWDAP